uniref:Uncharacterized protein n=1 Tax=Romanomermis culicivorax TaxID=13658 RepID=A0A915HRC1_ROMCU
MNPNQQNSLNMIPPSFGQSRIPNLETLYTNAAASQVTAPQIGNFNFVHHASSATNPYFLANILSQQPSIMNHHSAMLAGGNDHNLNQQISSSMVNRHHQVQMYDNFIYHHHQQQQPQQHNRLLAASSAAASFNYNAEAKKFAAAAQYSQILPPFFAAAANSTTNMMLANALLANSYSDVSRNSMIAQSSSTYKDNLNINKNSVAETMTSNQMVKSVPNSNNEAVYLPSPASNKSSLSACDAKSLDRSPFAHPCKLEIWHISHKSGPGSHHDLNVHSPSNMSVQRTSSNLSFQSPAAVIADRSPVVAAVISPSLANLGLVPQSPACAINPKMSLFHTNTQSPSGGDGDVAFLRQYVVAASPKLSQSISNVTSDFQTGTPKANNLILASVTLSNEQQKSHFYVQDRNHNSTTVTSMENSIRNFDLIDEHSSHILDVEPCGSQAPAVVQQQPYRHSWSKNDEDLAATRKNKNNNNAKENELAEIDREFARHFNAIVQKDAIQIVSSQEIKLPDKMDTFTADLDFCTSKKLPTIALSFIASSPIGMTFSPISFDNNERDDQGEIDDTLINRFPHLGKYFGPLSPKVRTSTNVFGDEILQQQTTSESETQVNASTPSSKWAPRKSKRVPIYKQQTQKARPQNAETNLHATAQAMAAPTTARVMSCDTKRLSLKVSLRSSPLSSLMRTSATAGGEEDDELDASVEQPSTSLAAEIKQETPDKQSLSCGLIREYDAEKNKKIEILPQNSEKELKNSTCGRKILQHLYLWFQAAKEITLIISFLETLYLFHSERKSGVITRRQKSSNSAAAGAAHPGGNAKLSVDEKLVEEEVKRKLMQISSLHPELRLAISNSGNKSDIGSGGTQEMRMHHNFSDEDAMRQTFTQPLTAADALRHVVPKKRLSTRQNSLTPPPPSQSSSVTPAFLPPRNSRFMEENDKRYFSDHYELSKRLLKWDYFKPAPKRCQEFERAKTRINTSLEDSSSRRNAREQLLEDDLEQGRV